VPALRIKVDAWSARRFSRPQHLLSLPSCSSVVLTRLGGPRFRPTNSKKNLVAPGIEPRPLDLQPGTLTTRPQRRSLHYHYPPKKYFSIFLLCSLIVRVHRLNSRPALVISFSKRSAFLPSRYLATAVEYLLIPRSLSSNGSI
jgi:hypothetical protein